MRSAFTLVLLACYMAVAAPALTALGVALSPASMTGQDVTFTGTESAVNVGSANVCPKGQVSPAPCSQTKTLTFHVDAGTTISTIGILTQGAHNLDFRAKSGDTSTTLCTAKTYTSATNCTVDVLFAPLGTGERLGAVQMIDGGGKLLVNTYIYGSGTGPVFTFTAGTITRLVGASGTPRAVAVDAGGNVYFIDDEGVKKIEAVNGAIPVKPTVRQLLDREDYSGLAVDGSGDVFLSSGDEPVSEIMAVDGVIPATPSVISLSGSDAGQDVAVDVSGNVYVAENVDGSIQEIEAVDGVIPATPTVRLLGSGLHIPLGVTVDIHGNVFVADTYNNAVKEMLAVGGSVPPDPTIRTLVDELNGPSAIAVDAGGNVYVVGLDTLLELVANDGVVPANPVINTLIGAGAGRPTAIAVDGSGNAFVAFSGGKQIVELDRTQTATLKFLPAALGTTSSDSPHSVTVQNVGNSPLALSGLTISTNFSQIPGSGTPIDCASGLSLPPGEECDLGIGYSPTATEPVNGAVTLTDNTLNKTMATHEIALEGNVLPEAQPLTTELDFGSVLLGEEAPDSKGFEVENVGGGTLKLTATINGPSFTLVPSTTCKSGIAPGSTCAVTVFYQPVTVQNHRDLLTLMTNGPTNPTVVLTGQTIGVGATTNILEFPMIAFGKKEVLPLTIRNMGTSAKVTVSASINGPSYKVLQTAQNTCLSGVNEGQSCVLPVEFDPVAAGVHNDTLTVQSSWGTTSTVKVYGTATTP